MGQQNGIDIFGANGLGVADSWNQVRIGGALGGDNPGDTLRQGSIAIFSNSGGFSTTIAQYLRMAGWGTTTVISSGKDVYIHYAAPEFAFALANDARSKAAVLYCEPGGYYELDANFTKPVVACVVGRWKSKLTRAVGHAGAMAGGHDDAQAKERWFMEKFGVDAIFTPEQPVVLRQGRGGDQHRPHPGRAHRGDARQRDVARLRFRRHAGAEGVVRFRRRARPARRTDACRWWRRSRRTTSRWRCSTRRSAASCRASR